MKVWGIVGGALLLAMAGGAEAGTVDQVIAECAGGEPMLAEAPETLFCQGIVAWQKDDIAGGHALFVRAAEMGYAPAQYLAGYDYREGYGVKQDVSLAMPLLLKAAEQGLADAQNDYGKIYLHGEDGIEADPEKAVPWLTKAAEQGYLHSQTLLAEVYYNASGVDQDVDKAVALYTQAAEAGHGYAQYLLGTIYSHGKAVPRDDAAAERWLDMAARLNVREAQAHLVQVYADKTRLNDPVLALTWLLVYAGDLATGSKAVTVYTDAVEGELPDLATLRGAVSTDQLKQAQAGAAAIREKLPADWRDVM